MCVIFYYSFELILLIIHSVDLAEYPAQIEHISYYHVLVKFNLSTLHMQVDFILLQPYMYAKYLQYYDRRLEPCLRQK